MQALVSVIMGSKSDWETMAHAVEMLEKLGVPCEVRVLSAHRTPDELFLHIKSVELRGAEVFIPAAGEAAHLAAAVSAKTLLPLLPLPIESKSPPRPASLLSLLPLP